MSIPKFPDPKDPDDITDFSLSFAEAMPPDDVIQSVEAVTIVPNNSGPAPASAAPDVSVASTLFSGQVATLWLAGGKNEWRYEISVLLTTAGGRTLRRRALLNVRVL